MKLDFLSSIGSFGSLVVLLSQLFISTGCDWSEMKPTPTFDITILNASDQDLDWVKLIWDGPHIPGGILIRGKSSTAVAAPAPKGNSATLEFVDEVTRERFTHTISLTEFHSKNPESISRIIFRILSTESVELVLVDTSL